MDLSKKLKEEQMNKLLERPLDLSQKNVMTDVREDVKPVHLCSQTLRYPTPTSRSSVQTAQSKQQPNIQSSIINPLLSVLAANVRLPVPAATLVQKVSPVRTQMYGCTADKQIDNTARDCTIAAVQRLSHVESMSSCGLSHTDLVKSVHPVISVVKPSAPTVNDSQLQSMSVDPTVNDNHSLHMYLQSQFIHTNQMSSPRFGTIMPASFDTGRTDRGVPLAQVYPSRVVTSTVQNTTTETVPSPVHCNKERLRCSPLNSTQVLDKNCEVVCSMSTSNSTKTSSHVETVAAVPALTSPGNCNTVRSLASIPTTSTEVSPTMPILSPNISSSRVSPEPCTAKVNSSKGILPSVETSSMSSLDRESVSDEYDSGHELFSTHMEWDDNNSMTDRKDFISDVCYTEELSIKRPAFEVVCDCNRTLLSDISQPCYAAVAFDRSLLQNKSGDRDFILRTKYYRFFSRKTYTAGSDLDAGQSDKCSSPNVTCARSRELRLPVPLSSALKGSSSSKSKSKASGALPTVAVQDSENLDDVQSKYSSTTESNGKCGFLDKKVRGVHHQKPSVTYDIIGSIYSPTHNSRPKGDSGIDVSDSDVQVKSELVEIPASTENKPDVLRRTVCRTRRRNIPTSSSNSCDDETVSNTDELNNAVSEWDRDSHRSAKSVDVKSAVGSDDMEYVASDLVDACSTSAFNVHSRLTEVSGGCKTVHCKQELLTESAVVTGGRRKNVQCKVRGGGQQKPGDANNNQGKTVASTTTSTRPASEPKHLKHVKESAKKEATSVDGSCESEYKVPGRTRLTRASMNSSNFDITSTYCLSRTTTTISKQQHMVSDSKSKSSFNSDDNAASLLPSKSDKISSEQTFSTSKADGQKFRSGRLLNKCTEEQSLAKVDVTVRGSKSDSSSVALDVTDVHSKTQSSILRQLESSEGYIAEKNIKYSQSEDLFDDSSLLSREQRALRVSHILQVKTSIFVIIDKYCATIKVKGQRSRHLYTATYRETLASSGLQLKWRTDRQ